MNLKKFEIFNIFIVILYYYELNKQRRLPSLPVQSYIMLIMIRKQNKRSNNFHRFHR
jgi:hypothetical protein